MRTTRKLLFAAVVLGLGTLGSMPPQASAIYQYCSTFYCKGFPSRPCTCPGSTIAITCGTWVPGQPCELP